MASKMVLPLNGTIQSKAKLIHQIHVAISSMLEKVTLP